MKKLLTIVAAALLGFSLVSCGTTSGVGGGKKTDETAVFAHPMTYVLDLADSTGAGGIKCLANPYGEKGVTDYQSNPLPSWKEILKVNKVQAGDTVRVTGVIIPEFDIDKITTRLVDNSAAANYWTNLDDADYFLEGLKAGEPYTIDHEFPIVADMKGEFTIMFGYGAANGGECAFKVERLCESYIGEASGFATIEERTEPKTHEIDVTKAFAFVEFALADPANPNSHYQANINIYDLIEKDWPIAGDKLHFTWKTKPNNDIANMYFRLAESSPSVNWWAELDTIPGQTYDNVKVTDIKKDEVNTLSFTNEFAVAPIENCFLVIWYNKEDCDSSSVFVMPR